MSLIKIKKGLDIPITGEPEQVISNGKAVKSVALIGKPFRNTKFSFKVKPGSKVKQGQVVAEDRANPEIKFVSPGSGKVVDITRGEKRAFLSLIIELDGKKEVVKGKSVLSAKINELTRDEVKKMMLAGGMWPIITQRPFGIVADPEVVPSSIFVSAMDTNPLAADPAVVIAKNKDAFVDGLTALGHLTDGEVSLCKSPNSEVPHGPTGKVINHLFDGVHPAGLVGTHIHYIDPISNMDKKVWSVGYQDVIALGKFITTGQYFVERYVALAGPQVKNPRIVKTVLGANLFDLTVGELEEGENRIISGSVLSGTQADENVGFLASNHNQVSVIAEDRSRVFHGFMTPGFEKFSVKKVFLSALNQGKKFAFGTNLEGSHRDLVPIGSYEEVMPLDIIPTFLVRSLLSNDLELAEKIGALELIEEDVALLTFVCPGKNDIGEKLMGVLDQIRKETE